MTQTESSNSPPYPTLSGFEKNSTATGTPRNQNKGTKLRCRPFRGGTDGMKIEADRGSATP